MTICAKNTKKEYSSLSEERRALLERKKIERTIEAFNDVREQTQAQQAQQNNQPQSQQKPQPQVPAQNTENEQTNKKFIFVRLVELAYIKKTEIANILDKGIKLVDQKDSNTGIVYNHATCSAMMLDGFYGLTLSGNAFALMREFITKVGNKNKFMTKVDDQNSKYALYAVEVDDEDYRTVKRQLVKFIKDPNLTYSAISNLFIGLDKIRRNIANLFKRRKSEQEQSQESDDEAKKQLKEKIKLVCSSFIAFIFYRYTKLREKLNGNKMKYTQVTPTDLVSYIPNMTLMHYGYFANYNKNCEEYVNKHKEFKQFFTREK